MLPPGCRTRGDGGRPRAAYGGRRQPATPEGTFPRTADARRRVSDDRTYESPSPASFWRRRARFSRDYVQSGPSGAVLTPKGDFRPALTSLSALPPGNLQVNSTRAMTLPRRTAGRQPGPSRRTAINPQVWFGGRWEGLVCRRQDLIRRRRSLVRRCRGPACRRGLPLAPLAEQYLWCEKNLRLTVALHERFRVRYSSLQPQQQRFGRLAQGESASLTRKRSEVQIF